MSHSVIVNPSMSNAFFHSYQLDEFFFSNFRLVGWYFLIFIHVLNEASVSKQWRT